MIRKLLNLNQPKTPSDEELEAQRLIEKINEKQRIIADKKEMLKNERINGARVTKHRFIV